MAEPSFTIEDFPHARGGLPLLVRARDPQVDLLDAFAAVEPLVRDWLPRCAGILFRGFALGPAPESAANSAANTVERFRAFAAAFGHPLLNYEFGSTPRTNVTSGVYTSTEYPADQHIPLHNEQAYTRDWPMRIWFCCVQAAPVGGETPIADSRAIYRRIPADIRERFERRGLMYVRNYGNGLDVPWQKVFNTEDRATVEAYCRDHRILCDWKEDGELRTRQICQATARHPVTGEPVWFNQAHLFHVSNLPEEARSALLDILDEEDLPRNVYHADGGPIDPADLAAIRAVLADETVLFPWETGDVMMLDNMLAAHARTPFSGPRKVVVAMAEPHSAD